MDTNAAYAAGLFDGEGCVLVVKERRPKTSNWYYRLVVTIAMSHKPTIEWLATTFNLGVVCPRQPRQIGYKKQFHFQCKANKAAKFLRIVRPYLITKAAEVDIALDFHTAHQKAKEDPEYSPRRGHPVEYYNTMEQYKLKLAALKELNFNDS